MSLNVSVIVSMFVYLFLELFLNVKDLKYSTHRSVPFYIIAVQFIDTIALLWFTSLVVRLAFQ